MATAYKKTIIKSIPLYREEQSDDQLYWKYLQFPASRKLNNAVTHLEFSPTEPNELAVTASARVEVCSCQTAAPLKVLSRFNLEAYSGSYRHDGRLMTAGGEEGVVRVFEVNSKSLLRWFKAHPKPVHVTRFTSDGKKVISGADDGTVKVLDLATREEERAQTEHTDYIRCGCVSPSSPELFVTGSYDQTAKILDIRTPTAALTVNHGAPIESVALSPSGSILYTAGGPIVKVWDVLGGGRLLTRLHGHHKTVTDIALSMEGRRLLTAGLDRTLKIYDTALYKVSHTMQCSGSLLSVAIASDDSAVAVGQTNGTFEVRLRKELEDIEAERQQRAQKRHRLEGYKRREGVSFREKKGDAVIRHESKPFLEKYDRMMKGFKYSKALDAALEIRLRTKNPEITFAVLRELIRRNGLRIALAGRDEKSIKDILIYLTKNLNNPLFLGTIIDITAALLELYNDTANLSEGVTKELKKIRTFVHQEVEFINRSRTVMGMLDTLTIAGGPVNLESQNS